MGLKDKKKDSTDTSSSDSSSTQPRDADFSALEDGAVEQASKGGEEASSAVAASNSASTQEISRLKAEVEENKDKYLRALAEMENYKKRTLKERSELLKYQGEKMIYDLLEVLDNLELAVSHSSADPAKLKAGLELIHKLFVDVLSRWEIRGVSSVGKEFDPSQHQALSKVAVDDAKPGTIINEFKKAYFYKDKLLRPGDVVVAVGKESSEDSEPSEPDESEGDEGGETAK